MKRSIREGGILNGGRKQNQEGERLSSEKEPTTLGGYMLTNGRRLLGLTSMKEITNQ